MVLNAEFRKWKLFVAYFAFEGKIIPWTMSIEINHPDAGLATPSPLANILTSTSPTSPRQQLWRGLLKLTLLIGFLIFRITWLHEENSLTQSKNVVFYNTNKKETIRKLWLKIIFFSLYMFLCYLFVQFMSTLIWQVLSFPPWYDKYYPVHPDMTSAKSWLFSKKLTQI